MDLMLKFFPNSNSGKNSISSFPTEDLKPLEGILLWFHGNFEITSSCTPVPAAYIYFPESWISALEKTYSKLLLIYATLTKKVMLCTSGNLNTFLRKDFIWTKWYIITSEYHSIGVKLIIVNENYKTKPLGTGMRNTP